MEEQANTANQSQAVCTSKMFTSKYPPFVLEENFHEYIRGSIEKRRSIILRNCRAVIKHELRNKIRVHREIEDKIHDDPQLHQNVEIFPRASADTKFSSICAVLCTRALLLQGRLQTVATVKKPKLEINNKIVEKLLKYHPVYTPPKRRILLMPNLTFNKGDVIPVYSDVPNEEVFNVQIPASLLFSYTDVNFVNHSKEKKLARAIKLSREPENTIRCDCCSNGSVVSCYENPNCRCYLLNAEMQKIQQDKTKKTEFGTFEPIYMTGTEATYGKYYGFACSELCECKGNCTNNSLLVINKKLFPLEVYRKDLTMGFGIRSPVLIPGGTPIMEFTGEICGYNLDTADYSFQITNEGDQEQINKLANRLGFTTQYKKLLNELNQLIGPNQQGIYIDPKKEGNVARMACHSCSANMEIYRIFQKSLSPAHVHLIFVAMLDIYPGTPLSIDYGHGYFAQQIGEDKCGCGTFVCTNSEDNGIFKELSREQMEKCYLTLDNKQWESWDAKIYKAVWDERNRIAGEDGMEG